jgi:hypothetical protein
MDTPTSNACPMHQSRGVGNTNEQRTLAPCTLPDSTSHDDHIARRRAIAPSPPFAIPAGTATRTPAVRSPVLRRDPSRGQRWLGRGRAQRRARSSSARPFPSGRHCRAHTALRMPLLGRLATCCGGGGNRCRLRTRQFVRRSVLRSCGWSPSRVLVRPAVAFDMLTGSM